MSDEKAAPKFLKPGDDPELDRLLAEARRDGSEPLGELYYDMFGRLRRAPVVDQDATTLVQSDRSNSNDKSVSTGPVVTETRPAAMPRKMPQSRVLALTVLGIVGPVIVLTIVALRPGAGAQGKRLDGLPARSVTASPGAAVELPSISGGAAPMTAPEDGGAKAARTTEPTGSALAPPGPGAKPGPKGPRSKSSGDPDPYPSAQPRKPNSGSDIW
jgi:hypothetical protein